MTRGWIKSADLERLLGRRVDMCAGVVAHIKETAVHQRTPDEIELAKYCLSLAVEARDSCDDAETIVDAAERFLRFVTTADHGCASADGGAA